MSDLLAKLSAPFPPDRISWRVGSTNKEKTRGMALAYIDARDVMQRLDEVCGVDGWQNRYVPLGTKTCCEIGVVINGACLWKADGAGDTDFEADKGAFSDAFKRAAVRWGIGRYLYDISAPWVAITAAGKSYAIVESELPKLQKLLPGSKAVTAKPAEAPAADGRAPERTLTKPQARPEYDKLVKEIKACGDVQALSLWGAQNKPRLDAQPPDWQISLKSEYADHKATLNGVHA